MGWKGFGSKSSFIYMRGEVGGGGGLRFPEAKFEPRLKCWFYFKLYWMFWDSSRRSIILKPACLRRGSNSLNLTSIKQSRVQEIIFVTGWAKTMLIKWLSNTLFCTKLGFLLWIFSFNQSCNEPWIVHWYHFHERAKIINKKWSNALKNRQTMTKLWTNFIDLKNLLMCSEENRNWAGSNQTRNYRAGFNKEVNCV